MLRLFNDKSDDKKSDFSSCVFTSSNPEVVPPSLCKPPISCELRDELCYEDATKLSEAITLAYRQKQPFLLYYINSPGGDVTDALEIVHLMQSSPVDIYTVNVGLAASAAFTVFCHGKKRFMAEHARLMLHDISVDFSQRVKGADIKTESAEMERLLQILLHTSEENCQLPKNTFQGMLKENRNSDRYILLKEAKELGIVTDVGIPWTQVNIQVDIQPVLLSQLPKLSSLSVSSLASVSSSSSSTSSLAPSASSAFSNSSSASSSASLNSDSSETSGDTVIDSVTKARVKKRKA